MPKSRQPGGEQPGGEPRLSFPFPRTGRRRQAEPVSSPDQPQPVSLDLPKWVQQLRDRAQLETRLQQAPPLLRATIRLEADPELRLQTTGQLGKFIRVYRPPKEDQASSILPILTANRAHFANMKALGNILVTEARQAEATQAPLDARNPGGQILDRIREAISANYELRGIGPRVIDPKDFNRLVTSIAIHIAPTYDQHGRLFTDGGEGSEHAVIDEIRQIIAAKKLVKPEDFLL